MSLTSRKEVNATILEWKGPLGVDNHVAFKDGVQALVDKKDVRLILDLGAVNFIDSTGLGVMTALLRRVKQLGGDLILVNIQEEVKPIFEITGLKKLFTIVPGIKEALSELRA